MLYHRAFRAFWFTLKFNVAQYTVEPVQPQFMLVFASINVGNLAINGQRTTDY